MKIHSSQRIRYTVLLSLTTEVKSQFGPLLSLIKFQRFHFSET